MYMHGIGGGILKCSMPLRIRDPMMDEIVTVKQPAAGPGPLSSEAIARANDLYWRSGASVNQLARELDLSKGALYEIIAPLPAGLPCPRGDGEMAYPNRTARERGFVSCAACGLEDEEEHVRDYLEEEEYGSALQLTASDRGLPPARAETDFGPLPARTLEKLLVASALAGVAVGFLLGGLLRRR